MASWQNNNRAHACLWLFEMWHHDRRDAKFTPSGQWSTDFLIRSAAGESAAMRKGKAQTHVEMLDGAFINLYRAQYEDGVDRDTALAAMLAVLNDRDKKLEDLGEPVDANYRFLGEI
ncbi:MAG: hypothetical protein OEN55_03730 [Alphaproteobacteria bacterium]|nr:hypothetical protein [Alphaproteobacteria bacterium]